MIKTTVFYLPDLPLHHKLLKKVVPVAISNSNLIRLDKDIIIMVTTLFTVQYSSNEIKYDFMLIYERGLLILPKVVHTKRYRQVIGLYKRKRIESAKIQKTK